MELKNGTENFVQDLKSGSNNILVAIRARPLNSKEMDFSS